MGLIYRVGRLFHSGLGLNGASLSVGGDWSIVILEGCSPFHNLSLTVLIWLAILKIAEQAADQGAFPRLEMSACFGCRDQRRAHLGDAALPRSL